MKMKYTYEQVKESVLQPELFDKELDLANFDFTSRVSADLDCNHEHEFAASIGDFLSCDKRYLLRITAFINQDRDDVDDSDGDLSNLLWDLENMNFDVDIVDYL